MTPTRTQGNTMMTTARQRSMSSSRPLHPTRAKGVIAPMALGVMILLSATLLSVFATVSTTAAVSRTAQENIEAQKNLDTATAMLTDAINGNPARDNTAHQGTATTENGNGPSHSTTNSFSSIWSWTRTILSPRGYQVGGDATLIGRANSITSRRDQEWRRREIGSYQLSDAGGGYTYGIAPVSVWQAAVATQDDSYISGRVSGDWHLYGNGSAEFRPELASSTAPRFLSYDDQATGTGGTSTIIRSVLTAAFDEHLLNERGQRCGTNLQRYVASSPPTLPADPNAFTWTTGKELCFYDIRVDTPITVSGVGVLKVYSSGPILIEAPITVMPTAELHLYTPSGLIRITDNTNVAGYIYAPNALCKTILPTGTLRGRGTITGSLACRQIEMTANFVAPTTLPAPWTAGTVGDGDPDHWIAYIETPGYRDRF